MAIAECCVATNQSHPRRLFPVGQPRADMFADARSRLRRLARRSNSRIRRHANLTPRRVPLRRTTAHVGDVRARDVRALQADFGGAIGTP